MFNAKASAVNVLTAVGKYLTLILFSTSIHAGSLSDPSFFQYESGSFTNRVGAIAFGWFKRLDDNEKHAYYSAINHAVFYADNGEQVNWSQGKAWGLAMPVVSWSTGAGYCRKVHIQASKYNVTKTMSRTACYQNGTDNWTWYADK